MNNYVDFALSVKGSRYLRRELSAVIETAEDPLPTFKPEARTAVRKSMKLNVRVVESEDYSTFYAMLEKNLRMRHNVTPTHSLDELEALARLFPERIRLFAAYAEKEMIGGIVLFTCNSRAVLAFYISHVEEHQSMRPVNQLIYQIIKWSYQRGYRYLDLGTFTLRMEPDYGLAKFKETFRARGVFRETLEIDL
jgi:lipid II:glycine glycyltransferase (peptidoglycan interpeptide bridge formation enzyme)